MEVQSVLSGLDELWKESTLEEYKELMRLLIENLAVSPTEAVSKVRFMEETEIAIKRGRWA